MYVYHPYLIIFTRIFYDRREGGSGAIGRLGMMTSCLWLYDAYSLQSLFIMPVMAKRQETRNTFNCITSGGSRHLTSNGWNGRDKKVDGASGNVFLAFSIWLSLRRLSSSKAPFANGDLIVTLRHSPACHPLLPPDVILARL